MNLILSAIVILKSEFLGKIVSEIKTGYFECRPKDFNQIALIFTFLKPKANQLELHQTKL